MRRKIYIKIIVLLLAVFLVASGLLISFTNQVDATGSRPSSVVDVDFAMGGGMGQGSITATSDGKLWVTGEERYGVFGDGGTAEDVHLGFTAVDTSFLDSPIKDIVSGMMRTTLLTENGRVYHTGGYDVDYNYILSYQAVDPALFGNSPVTKVFRNVFYEIFQTADGKLYYSPDSWGGKVYTVHEVPLPDDGVGLVTPVQTMAGMSGTILYLLDSAGRVWLADNWSSFASDPVTYPINWIPCTTPEPVTIKSMVMIRDAFFLTTDGRVLLGSFFDDPVLGNISTPDHQTLIFTSITDVTEFVPYYAPTVHSDMPNIRKSDGHIYVGAPLMDAYGANTGLTSTDYVDMSIYIPGIEQARILTIGVPPYYYVDNISSGLYLIGDKLYSINGDVVASNGVLTQEGSPLPPLTTAPAVLPGVEYVLDPVTPTFEGSDVNPTAAFLGPYQQGTIPVQVNWQIKNDQGTVVQQGTMPETADQFSTGVRLDIATMQLPHGTYSLSFFRETAPSYTGTYMRSAGTASANFTIRLAGGAVTVRFLDESANELAPAQVLNGNQGEAYTTTPVTIPNYELITTPTNASGVFTADPQTVDYIYQATATAAPVTVRFLDESAKELAPAQVLNGKLGEAYSTMPKAIANYELKSTPDNATGVFTAVPQNVDYIYRAAYTGAPVTVHHVNEAGQSVGDDQILQGNIGDPYEAFPISRPGLYILERPANAKGVFTDSPQSVTFVYTGNAQTKVIVKFQNEAGKDIAESQTLQGFPGTPYKTEPKTISGYTLIKTPANSSGTFSSTTQEVIYVYSQNTVPKTGEKETLMGMGGLTLLALAGGTLLLRGRKNSKI